MSSEIETLLAETAELKRERAELEALAPLRAKVEKLTELVKSLSKPPATKTSLTQTSAPATKTSPTQTSQGATGEIDINDITIANLRDPKKAIAVVAAIRRALAS